MSLAENTLSQVIQETQKLSRENTELRSEIQHWREVGGRVAEHEGKLADLILQHSALESTLPAKSSVKTSVKVSMDTEANQSTWESVKESAYSLFQNTPTYAAEKLEVLNSYMPQQLVGGGAIYVGLIITALVGFYITSRWLKVSKAGFDFGQSCLSCSPRRSLEKVLTLGGKFHSIDPLLRWTTIKPYIIEVDEMHIGGFPKGTMRLTLSTGSQEFETSAIVDTRGTFVRFPEAFTFEARLTDSSCVFCVFNDALGVEVGRKEMSAKEVLALATRRQEYYRTDLNVADVISGVKVVEGRSRPKPFAAMRVRDVTTFASKNSGVKARAEESSLYALP